MFPHETLVSISYPVSVSISYFSIVFSGGIAIEILVLLAESLVILPYLHPPSPLSSSYLQPHDLLIECRRYSLLGFESSTQFFFPHWFLKPLHEAIKFPCYFKYPTLNISKTAPLCAMILNPPIKMAYIEKNSNFIQKKISSDLSSPTISSDFELKKRNPRAQSSGHLCDVLKYWHSKMSIYPSLAAMTRYFLTVFGPHCRSLSAESIKNLLCLEQWYYSMGTCSLNLIYNHSIPCFTFSFTLHSTTKRIKHETLQRKIDIPQLPIISFSSRAPTHQNTASLPRGKCWKRYGKITKLAEWYEKQVKLAENYQNQLFMNFGRNPLLSTPLAERIRAYPSNPWPGPALAESTLYSASTIYTFTFFDPQSLLALLSFPCSFLRPTHTEINTDIIELTTTSLCGKRRAQHICVYMEAKCGKIWRRADMNPVGTSMISNKISRKCLQHRRLFTRYEGMSDTVARFEK
ncbi:hypothetical protein VP01_1334g2 [Puccinia sorghi]|uniref:Uncharacterized protein n=1 Tax=Puccinia sorghi TaxID=27349 RepID=A0A0L6VMD8_9BASI|nr:hypothetical protein VP01_1334g2 [Puccinia sorghi]